VPFEKACHALVNVLAGSQAQAMAATKITIKQPVGSSELLKRIHLK
jgi:hypothetical protein